MKRIVSVVLQVILLLGVTYVIFALGLPALAKWVQDPDATVVEDRQTLIINSTGPVDVIAYTTSDSTEASALYNDAGEVVLQTQAGIKPNYFEGKATLPGGTYKSSGGETVYRFYGVNFISYKTPDKDVLDHKLGVSVWIFCFIFIGGMLLLMEYASRRMPNANISDQN